mmetsp:Transcript_40583/g.90205  ORF Transcript_40583/g.90205 Transcript_40583/m.90205 type:complete len:291 (+) Transcript_40583:2259-3131(+)
MRRATSRFIFFSSASSTSLMRTFCSTSLTLASFCAMLSATLSLWLPSSMRILACSASLFFRWASSSSIRETCLNVSWNSAALSLPTASSRRKSFMEMSRSRLSSSSSLRPSRSLPSSTALSRFSCSTWKRRFGRLSCASLSATSVALYCLRASSFSRLLRLRASCSSFTSLPAFLILRSRSTWSARILSASIPASSTSLRMSSACRSLASTCILPLSSVLSSFMCSSCSSLSRPTCARYVLSASCSFRLALSSCPCTFLSAPATASLCRRALSGRPSTLCMLERSEVLLL